MIYAADRHELLGSLLSVLQYAGITSWLMCNLESDCNFRSSYCNKVFDVQVALVQRQFIEALEALFENHKKDLGFENTTLEVL